MAWPAVLDRTTPPTQRIPRISIVDAYPTPTGWVMVIDRARHHGPFNMDPKQWAVVLAAGAVRFTRDPKRGNRYLVHVTTRDPLAEPLEPRLLPLHPGGKYSWRDGYELGRYENGDTWRLGIAGGHVLISGITGAGKSTLLQLVVGQALIDPECDVAIVDPQGGVQFGHWEPWARWFASELDGWREVLTAVHAEMEARYEQMRADTGIVRNWTGARIILVIDEIATVFADRQVTALVDDLSRRCRAAGITIIGCTQRSDHESMSIRFRAQCATRIALALGSDLDSDLALDGKFARDGITAAGLRQGEGRALVRDLTHPRIPVAARSWDVPVSRIEALVSILPLVDERQHPAAVSPGPEFVEALEVVIPAEAFAPRHLRSVPTVPEVVDASGIADRRKSLGMTQPQLAESVGVHVRTIRNAEAGKASDDTVRRVVHALDELEASLVS